MITRRLFVGSTLSLALARRAQAQMLATLQCSSAPDEDVSSVLYAQDSGMFKRAGLNVQITRSNSGAAVSAAVAGGSIDIGKTSLMSLITAHLRGLPFVIVAPAGIYSADHPDVSMLVAKESPIQGARDLEGTTIGVPALSDLFTIVNAAFIDAAGGSWKSVHYLELPSASSADAIVAHRVDAATLAEPMLTEALTDGQLRSIGHPPSALAKRFIRAVWFTTRDFATKNAAIVAAFRRTAEQAGTYINVHPEALTASLAAFTGMDQQLVNRIVRGLSATHLDVDLLQPTIEAAYKYAAIPARFDAKELLV